MEWGFWSLSGVAKRGNKWNLHETRFTGTERVAGEHTGAVDRGAVPAHRKGSNAVPAPPLPAQNALGAG